MTSLELPLFTDRGASRFPVTLARRGGRGSAPSAALIAPGPDERLRPIARWRGDGEMRAVVADHVEAAGGLLRDDDPTSGEPPVLEIRTLTDLRRRRRRDAAPSALPLLVVTADPSPSEEDWQACLETGARSLLRLPRQSDALLEHLGALLRRRSGCHLIGVTGGAGGAGASSWAARLAGAAARHGGPTVLVDADPLGGGMDVLIEAPSPDRGAWEDLGHLGAGDGEMLREGLPLIDGVGLLTSRAAAGHPLPDEVVGALSALGELDGTAVVDLAAQLVPDALPHLDRLVVVVPATDHGVRAAWRRLQVWRPPSARTGVVVRRVGPLAPRDVAGDLALPLWGAYRDAPRGAVPLMDRRRGGPDRLCEQLLRDWSATS